MGANFVGKFCGQIFKISNGTLSFLAKNGLSILVA